MAKKYCVCDMFFDSGRSEPARCEFCGGVQKPEPPRVQVAAQQCLHTDPPTARSFSATCPKCGTFVGVDFGKSAGG